VPSVIIVAFKDMEGSNIMEDRMVQSLILEEDKKDILYSYMIENFWSSQENLRHIG